MALKKVTPKQLEKAKADIEKEAAEKKPSRNIGVTSGKRIWEYQNDSLMANRKEKLTDDELAADWRREFPQAMEFGPAMVKTVRALFNKGKHKNDVPDPLLHEYDAEGNKLPLPTRGRKKAAEAEAEEEEEETAAPAPAKKLKK